MYRRKILSSNPPAADWKDKKMNDEKESCLYRDFLATAEKPLIEKILAQTKGNKSEAARILGINRNTLDAKLKRLNIEARRFKL